MFNLFPQRINTNQGATPLPRTRPMLRIDLDAVADNWRALNTITNQAECSAVVKADAYGLGVAPIARRLVKEGCKTFFVAIPDEAFALRDSLPDPDINIFCLGGLSEPADAMIEYNIIPVINHAEDLQTWMDTAKTVEQKLPAALHFDTGLNRLGFSLAEAEILAEDTSWREDIDLVLVMSHLACADEPFHPLTDIQNWRFQALRELFPDTPASLAASDGIFRGSNKHYDLVRPGAALYGVNPTPERPTNPMKPVVTLTAPVIQLRTVDMDGPVGYSATRNVIRGQRLAVVAYGYADGLFRSASNAAKFYYNGMEMPVIGRVSMDVTILDVSNIPDGELEVGTHVVVIGQNQSVDDLAKSCGTIGYEILTALGNRFERFYVEKNGKK